MNRTKQHTTARQVLSVLFCAVLIFTEKIRILLRRHGLSARALAHGLELSNSTVAGWLKTARPQPAQAKRLSEFFGVPLRDLLDDSCELPPDPTEARFTEAKAAAARMPADQPLARQAVFEKTLDRSYYSIQMREIAGRLRSQAAVWMRWADELDHPPADKRKN